MVQAHALATSPAQVIQLPFRELRNLFLQGVSIGERAIHPQNWHSRIYDLLPASLPKTLRMNYLDGIPIDAHLIDMGGALGKKAAIPFVHGSTHRSASIIDNMPLEDVLSSLQLENSIESNQVLHSYQFSLRVGSRDFTPKQLVGQYLNLRDARAVDYISYELTGKKESLPKMDDSKELHIIALSAPQELGLYALGAVQHYKAQSFYVTQSALDEFDEESPTLQLLDGLDLEAADKGSLRNLLLSQNSVDARLPYKSPASLVQGESLKGLIALAEAKKMYDVGYDVSLVRLNPDDAIKSYCMPDIALKGTKR